MFTVGRVCVKLAGRDADKKCVIVRVENSHVVLIDGETRRRKCNVRHLLPLDQTVELKKGTHDEVVAAFKQLGIELRQTKPKKAGARPRAVRKKKEAVPAKPSEAKPEAKPAAPPTEQPAEQ